MYPELFLSKDLAAHLLWMGGRPDNYDYSDQSGVDGAKAIDMFCKDNGSLLAKDRGPSKIYKAQKIRCQKFLVSDLENGFVSRRSVDRVCCERFLDHITWFKRGYVPVALASSRPPSEGEMDGYPSIRHCPTGLPYWYGSRSQELSFYLPERCKLVFE
jgi:hypothetical protein